MNDRVALRRLGSLLFSCAWAVAWTSAPALAAGGFVEIAHVDFNRGIPGQPPATGGVHQPTALYSQPGTSVVVRASANGIATQPVVVAAQGANEFASVETDFVPVSAGIARIEAVVAFDRIADGSFLETTAGTGSYPNAVVTRLVTSSSGQVLDDITRTIIGTYGANRPFGVRVEVDMTRHTWSAIVDPQPSGFDDDPVIGPLPFENPVGVLPTVGAVWGSLDLFPVVSAGPTSVAYDDIRVSVPAPVPTARPTWGRLKTLFR